MWCTLSQSPHSQSAHELRDTVWVNHIIDSQKNYQIVCRNTKFSHPDACSSNAQDFSIILILFYENIFENIENRMRYYSVACRQWYYNNCTYDGNNSAIFSDIYSHLFKSETGIDLFELFLNLFWRFWYAKHVEIIKQYSNQLKQYSFMYDTIVFIIKL